MGQVKSKKEDKNIFFVNKRLHYESYHSYASYIEDLLL